MSAKDQMRAMLDQLMGSSRNGESTSILYSDPSVCRAFLLSCCPYTVLAETRLELGECSKVHQLSLRPDFEAAQSREDHFYDVDACAQLSAFITEWDRKIEGYKKKLSSTQEALTVEVTGKVNKVQELAQKIESKLAEAEEMGTQGKVDESMTIMEDVERLQAEKATAEQDYNSSIPELNLQQQKLRVCEVCSAYLGIHEIDRSLADHFGGKLHLGFKELRDKLAEMQKDIEERRELQRQVEKKKQESRRESTNNKLLRLSQKERSRSKGRRDRSRSRSRDRRKKQKRSRSRSRSRSKKERYRRRSNSRNRKHRSRSRERRKRSRSRGRYRSRSRSHHKHKDRPKSGERNRRRSRSDNREKNSRRRSISRSRESGDDKHSKLKEDSSNNKIIKEENGDKIISAQ